MLSIRESEDYIRFRDTLFRKNISLSKFANKYGLHRETIHRYFKYNKREKIDDLFKKLYNM